MPFRTNTAHTYPSKRQTSNPLVRQHASPPSAFQPILFCCSQLHRVSILLPSYVLTA
jgi:hypothetical protein